MKATLLLLKLRESNNCIPKMFSLFLYHSSWMEFHCETDVKVQYGISFKYYYYGISTMSWFNSLCTLHQPWATSRNQYVLWVRSRTRPFYLLYFRKGHRYSKWKMFRRHRWRKNHTRKKMYVIEVCHCGV